MKNANAWRRRDGRNSGGGADEKARMKNAGPASETQPADTVCTPDQPTRRARTSLARLGRLVLGTIVAGYVLICAAIFFFQGHLIYFPAPNCAAAPMNMVGLPFEEVTLTTADDLSLAAWYVPHLEAQGTVLFCHGNAGNMAGRCQTLKSFHRLGYAVLIFDYRGYGGSTGTPDEAGLYCDAETAWRYLTEAGGEAPERIVLFGRSLGSAVAIDLATRHRPGALVVEAAFSSLVDIGKRQYPFLPVGLLCTHQYESIRKVAHIDCPKLFLHGTDDELVPLALARQLYEAAASPKAFIETPGGHNDSGFEYSPEYTSRMGSWLDTVRTGTAR